MLFQPISHYVAALSRQELQVFANQSGISQAESRMMLTQLNQSFIISKHIGMLRLAFPVDGIDGVRTLIAVVYALLILSR